ncbi:uncharacterized protein TM35_000981000, partial [Trypanosoma theileri]
DNEDIGPLILSLSLSVVFWSFHGNSGELELFLCLHVFCVYVGYCWNNSDWDLYLMLYSSYLIGRMVSLRTDNGPVLGFFFFYVDLSVVYCSFLWCVLFPSVSL